MLTAEILKNICVFWCTESHTEVKIHWEKTNRLESEKVMIDGWITGEKKLSIWSQEKRVFGQIKWYRESHSSIWNKCSSGIWKGQCVYSHHQPHPSQVISFSFFTFLLFLSHTHIDRYALVTKRNIFNTLRNSILMHNVGIQKRSHINSWYKIRFRKLNLKTNF